AGGVEFDVLGQAHRQVFARHGHDAAGVAMDHRDRAAPIALAGNTPVAQAVIDLADALRLALDQAGFEVFGDGRFGGVDVEPVEETGIEGYAGSCVSLCSD